MPKRYTTPAQMREKFIKDGWSKNISFRKLTLKEAKAKGLNGAKYCFSVRNKSYAFYRAIKVLSFYRSYR